MFVSLFVHRVGARSQGPFCHLRCCSNLRLRMPEHERESRAKNIRLLTERMRRSRAKHGADFRFGRVGCRAADNKRPQIRECRRSPCVFLCASRLSHVSICRLGWGLAVADLRGQCRDQGPDSIKSRKLSPKLSRAFETCLNFLFLGQYWG